MNTVKNQVKVTQNSYTDEGEGVVSFPNGLCISDDQVQRNGTRYDIDSLDISRYSGMLTADHEDKLKNIIGRVEGLEKKDGCLTVNRIVYAVKQNPYARLAYDLLIGGFSNAFSTETLGAPNDVDGVLRNHELVGLSQVVTPNNYSAIINTVRNSLSKAKADGLNIDGIENEFLNEMEKEPKMENENEAKEVVETPEVVTETSEVENKAPRDDEDDKRELEKEAREEAEDRLEDAVEAEIAKKILDEKKAEEEKAEAKEVEAEKAADEEDNKKDKKMPKINNDISAAEVEQMFRKLDEVINLVEDLRVQGKEEREDTVRDIVDDARHAGEDRKEDKAMNKDEVKNAVEEVLNGYFKNEAQAPAFQKAENGADYDSMSWKDRYTKQVNAAYEAFRLGDVAAHKTLNEINKANFNALKEAGIARNSMTIESMGNFVIPPEMYREMVGKRTDYSKLIDATNWRETDSLEFAWLRRNGDIDMKNVALCDDGKNGNLKPISEYSATPVTSKMEEMAAVTVVCNAATRFFAVDLLADVAAGYRNDYDRKRAQLVIARLEQAVIENGQSVAYAPTTDTEAVLAWLKALEQISDSSTEGTLIFNNKTWAQLKAHVLAAGMNGPLGQVFVDGEFPRIFGTRFIVVPNDLMPTIESQDQISFMVDGEAVNITHAVFYADLNEFTGYTSGGLQYDVSTQASYEVAGGTRSAYQRNELVLRGSFYRGGAIMDISRVSGILQQAAQA